MNIEFFSEFTMVAKHGNLSQAAQELNTTQTALSRHLSLFEKELGGKLYDRSRSPMELTRLGEMVLREGNLIACQYERIKELAAKIRRETATTVTIGGSLTPIEGKLLRHVRETTAADGRPFYVRFENLSSHTPFNLIREGVVDVAVEPLSNLINVHDLVHDHLFYDEMCVVVQRGHELAGETCIDACDLANFDFISLLGNVDHAIRKHLQMTCDQFGNRGTYPRRLYASPVSHSFEELFFNGLEGSAVALPKSVAVQYAGGDSDYVMIPVAGEDTRYDFHVFRGKGCSKSICEFVEMLCDAARATGFE